MGVCLYPEGKKVIVPRMEPLWSLISSELLMVEGGNTDVIFLAELSVGDTGQISCLC